MSGARLVNNTECCSVRAAYVGDTLHINELALLLLLLLLLLLGGVSKPFSAPASSCK